MKLSSIAIPAALALLANAESEQPLFKSFDKSQLSSDSFFEQFDSDDWAQLWKISKAKRDDEFTYNGEWAVEESVIYPHYKNDKGLVLKTPAAHHAIHAALPKPFVNTDNTLVLQYEVKLQEGLKCGGAYVKLLSSEGLPNENSEFNNETPYQVMFGPDKCGATNKVHFIIRRKDASTGEYEEKHLSVPPLSRGVKTTSLYTLIMEPNQDFSIRINGDVVKAGNLLDKGTLAPGLNPAKEIDDPNDTKPEDWDDNEYILDPEETEKPEDWDEDAPRLIPDPNDIKPETWDEAAEEFIPEPDAEKPEDWDDEEDGEWVAPLVLNPECQEHGCGPWKPRNVENPNYKGKWIQPTIENPNYKGDWKPKKIENPDYYEDVKPSDLEAIGGIGFELWSIENDILFDNIYLGHSIEEAELIGNETFTPKFEIEQQSVLDSAPKPKEVEEPVFEDEESEDEGILASIIEQIKIFAEEGQAYFQEFLAEPLETLSNRPVEAGLYAGVLISFATFVLSFLSVIVGYISGTKESVVKPISKKEEIKEEIKEAEGKTSGSKTSETSASKRS